MEIQVPFEVFLNAFLNMNHQSHMKLSMVVHSASIGHVSDSGPLLSPSIASGSS